MAAVKIEQSGSQKKHDIHCAGSAPRYASSLSCKFASPLGTGPPCAVSPMMLSLLLALHAAVPADIEFRATVRARSLTVEKAGRANVVVTANGRNVIAVEGAQANGRRGFSNPVFEVNIEGRIAEPPTAPQAPPQTN